MGTVPSAAASAHPYAHRVLANSPLTGSSDYAQDRLIQMTLLESFHGNGLQQAGLGNAEKSHRAEEK